MRSPISFRLSDDCHTYLEHLENLDGITKSAIIEMAVREYYCSRVDRMKELGRLAPAEKPDEKPKKKR